MFNSVWKMITIICLCFFTWLITGTEREVKKVSISCPDFNVNILTGEKNYSGGRQIDPSIQACTRGDSCDSQAVPYSLNSDATTSVDGVCKGGRVCRCTQRPQCMFGTTSVFKLEPNLSYSQRSSSVSDSYNIPLTYDDENETCTIESYTLDGFRCASPFNVLACIKSNPCQSGTMAFIGTYTTLSSGELQGKIGCFAGPECKETGKIPVYDTSTFKLTC
jgi:hypothetical protein